MDNYRFNEEKDRLLKTQRGFGFKTIIKHIEKGNVVKVINNPNKQKYPKQKMYLIKMKNKIVIVPFIEEINYNFLKTIYPSQKYTKKYLGRNYRLIK